MARKKKCWCGKVHRYPTEATVIHDYERKKLKIEYKSCRLCGQKLPDKVKK